MNSHIFKWNKQSKIAKVSLISDWKEFLFNVKVGKSGQSESPNLLLFSESNQMD